MPLLALSTLFHLFSLPRVYIAHGRKQTSYIFNSSHSQRRADTTRRNDDDHEHQECLMMISSSPVSSELPQNGAFASHSKDAENGNEKLKTPSTACS